MVKNKKKKRSKDEKSEDEAVQKILDSISQEDYNQQSTSPQARTKKVTASPTESPTKKAKLNVSKGFKGYSSPQKKQVSKTANQPKRRDAIDDAANISEKDNDADTSSSDNSESDVSTDEDKNASKAANVSTRNVATQTNFVFIDNKEFEEFKAEQKKDIKSLRRSVVYSINQVEKTISNYFVEQNKRSPFNEIKKLLNLEEPIQDLETFLKFDNKIKNDDEFADNFRQLLSFKTRAKHLHEAIGAVLNIGMSNDLQQQFSGCGKPNKGVAKENFSSTKIYVELKDNLLRQFETETEATVLTKTSRWLASVKYRNGGKDLN